MISARLESSGFTPPRTDIQHAGTTLYVPKINQNGRLELIDSSPKMMSKGNFIIHPKVGDFYLFPAYLIHTVYPFTETDEERRSVSFNAALDPVAASI